MRARKGSPGARRGRRQRRQLSEHVASQSSSEGRHKKQFTDWVGSGRREGEKGSKNATNGTEGKSSSSLLRQIDWTSVGWTCSEGRGAKNSRSDVVPFLTGGVRPRSLCTYILRGGFFAASAPACLPACLPACHMDWGEGLSLPETFRSFASFDPRIY